MWWYCSTDGFYAEAYGCMEAIGCHLGPTPSIDETVHTNAVTLRAASEPLVTSSAHEQHTMPSGGTNGKGRGGVKEQALFTSQLHWRFICHLIATLQ